MRERQLTLWTFSLLFFLLVTTRCSYSSSEKSDQYPAHSAQAAASRFANAIVDGEGTVALRLLAPQERIFGDTQTVADQIAAEGPAIRSMRRESSNVFVFQTQIVQQGQGIAVITTGEIKVTVARAGRLWAVSDWIYTRSLKEVVRRTPDD